LGTRINNMLDLYLILISCSSATESSSSYLQKVILMNPKLARLVKNIVTTRADSLPIMSIASRKRNNHFEFWGLVLEKPYLVTKR